MATEPYSVTPHPIDTLLTGVKSVAIAVTAGITRAFFDAEEVQYEILPSNTAIQTEAIATRARQFTLKIESWK